MPFPAFGAELRNDLKLGVAIASAVSLVDVASVKYVGVVLPMPALSASNTLATVLLATTLRMVFHDLAPPC